MLSQTTLYNDRMKKKTILFGAGASIPFFRPALSTEYLTKKVLGLNSWKDILHTYEEVVKGKHDIPSASEIRKVLCSIKNIYESNGKKINFEQLAEIIDKISSIEDDFAPDSNMLNLLLHTINARPMNLPCWKNVPLLFREIIARSIIDLQRSHKVAHFDELIESQHKLLCAICGKFDYASIVSLNYDDCV